MSYTNHKAELRYNSTLSGTGVASDNGAIQSVFTYEQTPITFSKGEGLMVNATQMAKAFGKLPKDWLNLKQTEELIHCVSVKRGIPLLGLVSVNHGGSVESGRGTWLHEDLALIFAQWLSPQFYLWCNDRIKELLTTGKTELAKLKCFCNFATTYITRGGTTASAQGAGFLSPTTLDIGYNTPSLLLNGATASSKCKSEGKVVPFFYYSRLALR